MYTYFRVYIYIEICNVCNIYIYIYIYRLVCICICIYIYICIEYLVLSAVSYAVTDGHMHMDYDREVHGHVELVFCCGVECRKASLEDPKT